MKSTKKQNPFIKKQYSTLPYTISSFEGDLFIGGIASSMIIDLLQHTLPFITFPRRLANFLGIYTTSNLDSKEVNLKSLLGPRLVQLYHTPNGIFLMQKNNNQINLIFLKRSNMYGYVSNSLSTKRFPIGEIYKSIEIAPVSDSTRCMIQTFFINMLLKDIQSIFQKSLYSNQNREKLDSIKQICSTLIDLCMKPNFSGLYQHSSNSRAITEARFNASQNILEQWYSIYSRKGISDLIYALNSIKSMHKQNNLYFFGPSLSASNIPEDKQFEILESNFPFKVIWTEESRSDGLISITGMESFQYAGRYQYITR